MKVVPISFCSHAKLCVSFLFFLSLSVLAIDSVNMVTLFVDVPHLFISLTTAFSPFFLSSTFSNSSHVQCSHICFLLLLFAFMIISPVVNIARSNFILPLPIVLSSRYDLNHHLLYLHPSFCSPTCYCAWHMDATYLCDNTSSI